jgi:CRP/FNR family transcriptional regulator, cyclic AMP receptor protein
LRVRPDSRERIAATLRASQPIDGWPPDVVAALAQQSQLRQYDKGEVIEERNDPVTGLWIVASGSVRSFRSTENGLYFLNSVLWPGDPFGVAAILDGWPTQLSYSTRCESLIVFVPKAAMEDAMRDVNRMRDMAVCMALRGRVVNEGVFMVHVESLAVQLAKLLAFLPRRSHAMDEAEPETPVWTDPAPIDLTQEELADMLSVSRQSLNRTLGPFLRNGILARDGNGVRVVSFKRLLAIMEQNEPLAEYWRNEILSWDERIRANALEKRPALTRPAQTV